MTIKGEYKKGFISGMMHDVKSALHRENLLKCRRGQLDEDYPLVAAYWHGYAAALDNRGISTIAVTF